jgi:hypothetical protein
VKVSSATLSSRLGSLNPLIMNLFTPLLGQPIHENWATVRVLHLSDGNFPLAFVPTAGEFGMHIYNVLILPGPCSLFLSGSPGR